MYIPTIVKGKGQANNDQIESYSKNVRNFLDTTPRFVLSHSSAPYAFNRLINISSPFFFANSKGV